MKRTFTTMVIALLAPMLLVVGCAPDAPSSGDSSSPASSNTPTPTQKTTTTSVSQSETPTTSSPIPSGEMPPVVGLTEEAARIAILEAAPNALIDPLYRQDSGEEGVVLEQDPGVGREIGVKVTLVISAGSIPVPDVSEMTFAEARKLLEEAGFAVEENSVFHPEALDGTVVGQRPAPGSQNEARVTLDVARKDAATYLSDMEPVEVDGLEVESDIAPTNGVEYTRALKLRKSSWGERGSISYNLGRGYSTFDVVVGVHDEASSDTRASIEILADEEGRSLYSTQDLQLGKPVTIEKLDVADVLRLKIRVTLSGKDAMLVLGDPRLSNPR
ncbi:PASTA domain-containing protein [Tessaracoccus caeni]|uniref:PASTA domain-containing protein n=1 Tax=Tessaracoccus caeni TaxID=3031239 RepID=UPI0023D9FE8E|nr:PASTA domain-containing protein [Tessaracoccus caeni]MDF1489596.1 PASTA domain-containing protein [Tessaracoccus caeni]